MIDSIRSYELSLWTLQDSFITVLKPSDLESKRVIKDGEVNLKDDGEDTLSFKIPMYITEENTGETIENPLWYNVEKGNLLVNMRKIKVIFNKTEIDEAIFEFIITKVEEEHEGFSKYCYVEGGGLAFHELGKQGYKISLSFDDFKEEHEQWADGDKEGEEPIGTIDYWVNKVLANTNWSYAICMDWSSEDGRIDSNYINEDEVGRERINKDREKAGYRRMDRVYRAPYVNSWKIDIDKNELVPESYIKDFNELERIEYPEGKEDNRYNLLRTIAEKFQVYCKFVYKYDENYHIIDRQVIYYNNFFNEQDDFIDFNYGYNAKKITREMDSNDLVTKMYIKPIDDAGIRGGQINLSDTPANKTLEDYLLNFDYLHDIGAISDEQYTEIPNFEAKIHKFNSSLIENIEEKNKLENELSILKARKDFLEDDIAEAIQRSTEAAEAAGEKDGEYTNNNPLRLIVYDSYADPGKYYCRVPVKGLLPETLKIYIISDNRAPVIINESNDTQIRRYKLIYDDLNTSPERINFTEANDLKVNSKIVPYVYAVFDFIPELPYKKVQELNEAREKKDREELEGINNDIATKEDRITSLDVLIESYKSILRAERAKFERFMGPALREGYWQPEGDYSKYQLNKAYSITKSLLTFQNTETDDTEVEFIWDNDLLDDEQKNYYKFGIALDEVYYPCINLSSFINDEFFLANKDSLYLCYVDPVAADKFGNNDVRAIRYLRGGASTGFKYAFLRHKNNKTIIPVLMVVGSESMVEEEDISVKNQIKNLARLSVIDTIDESMSEDVIINSNRLANTWIDNEEDYEIVYPRIVVNSSRYLMNTPTEPLYKDGEKLEVGDYYISNKLKNDKQYITIKPEVAFDGINLDTQYDFYYALSTAAEAIYLDALQIMVENSQPKVSYTVDALPLDETFIHSAYNKLTNIVHINDIQLKFENVRGYISEVKLNLDKPWEDVYTIKNYKSKFEDLFSTIVAQTVAMKKNEQVIDMTSNLITSTGQISSAILDKSMMNTVLIDRINKLERQVNSLLNSIK